ncbi:major facilitator superfamily domain-containing protein [Scleroderma yunnanense]
MSENTTRVSEDLEVAQDTGLPSEGKHLNRSDDHDKASPKGLDKYRRYAGDPPDGGAKAWSVILGASLTTFASFGYINTWGLYQDYYEHVLLPDSSPSTIAWIGSVQYALIFLPGLVTGRLFDLGYLKLPYFAASCLLIICTFLTAECKTYWQFFLAQGLGGGLASGILFGPALGVIRHWFSKRSGLALGFTAAGSSLGGTVFPIIGQNLLPLVGFKWTVRVFGFIILVALGVSNITIDRRLPPVDAKGGLFNWAAFRNPAYTVYCLAGISCLLGLYTVLTYLPTSANLVGIENGYGFYLVAIANASSAIGRLSAGWLADRVGPLNVMIPFTAVAGIMSFVWPLATSQGSLTAVSVIYGIACGTYVSLLVAPVFEMGEVGDVGRRTGMFLTVATFGVLTGPPISGAINERTGGFKEVGYYAGGVIVFSVLLLIVVRHLLLGRLFGKA